MNPALLSTDAPAARDVGRFHLRMAVREDDAQIRRLLRESVMGGKVQLALTCEPDSSLAAGVAGDRHDTVLVHHRENDELAGVGSRSVRDIYYDGRPARIGYLHQMRVRSKYRTTPRVLAGVYEMFDERRQPDELPLDITTVVADNHRAIRLLEADLPGKPSYHRLATMTSCVIRTRRFSGAATAANLEIRRAADADLDQIFDLVEQFNRRHQFATRWHQDLDHRQTLDLKATDFLLALRGSRLVACLAVWDQSKFKQVVVDDYEGAMRWCRPWLNACGALTAIPYLPRPGSEINSATISHIGLPEGEESAFCQLLNQARTIWSRQVDSLAIGLFDQSSLTQIVQRKFRPFRYRSHLYAVCYRPGEQLPAKWDRLCPHLELAVL